MSDIPDRDRIAADEQRIGALLRAVEAPAPAVAAARASRARRAQAADGARVPGARRRGRARLRVRLPVVVAAAVALVLVAARHDRADAAPTVVRASPVALARPTAAAPRARLIAAGTTIAFPRLVTRVAGRAAGTRTRPARRAHGDDRVLPLGTSRARSATRSSPARR